MIIWDIPAVGNLATGGTRPRPGLRAIDVDRVRITTFTLCGLLAAFADIVQVARLKSVDPLRGQGMERVILSQGVYLGDPDGLERWVWSSPSWGVTGLRVVWASIH